MVVVVIVVVVVVVVVVGCLVGWLVGWLVRCCFALVLVLAAETVAICIACPCPISPPSPWPAPSRSCSAEDCSNHERARLLRRDRRLAVRSFGGIDVGRCMRGASRKMLGACKERPFKGRQNLRDAERRIKVCSCCSIFSPKKLLAEKTTKNRQAWLALLDFSMAAGQKTSEQ